MDRLDDQEYRWFALRTPNRHEKMAAKFLERAAVDHYLPLQSVKRIYSSKVVKRQICLLPCYIFVRITKQEEGAVYRNPYANFLKIGSDRIDIPPRDIEMMQFITGEKELEWKTCAPDLWQKGDPVELVGGSFTGLKGYYLQQHNKKQFIVALESSGLLDGLVATVDSRYVIRPR